MRLTHCQCAIHYILMHAITALPSCVSNLPACFIQHVSPFGVMYFQVLSSFLCEVRLAVSVPVVTCVDVPYGAVSARLAFK